MLHTPEHTLAYYNWLYDCFSTGVPPLVSKGSMEPPVLRKKVKLRPTFAATRRHNVFAVGSAPNPLGELTALPKIP